MVDRLVTFIVHAAEDEHPGYDEIQDWRQQIGSGEAEIYKDEPFEDVL